MAETKAFFQIGLRFAFVLLMAASQLIACTRKESMETLGMSTDNGSGGAPTEPPQPPTVLPPSVLVLGAISPVTAPMTGGLWVTITGVGFTNGMKILIGGLECTSIFLQSPLMVSCVVPSHPPGNAEVVVTRPDGQSATLAMDFVYTDLVNPVQAAALTSGGGFKAFSVQGTGMKAYQSIGTVLSPTVQTYGTEIRVVSGPQGVFYDP